MIWVFIFAIMAFHLFLQEQWYMGWDFSGLGWSMRFSLAWPTGEELFSQRFWNSVMICHYQVLYKQHDCLQVRHLWDQEKKLVFFTTESLSTCFLIHYIYTNQATVVNLADVRTKNKCFGCWILCSSCYIKSPTHIINIYC